MKGSRSGLGSRVVEVLVALLLRLAATLKAVDAGVNLLMLAPVISLQLVDAVVHGCAALTKQRTGVADGAKECEAGEGQVDESRGFDGHGSIIPLGLGLSSKKSEVEGAGVAPTYSRL